MGNIKIRNLTAATSADIISGDMVPIALDDDAGLERVTRRATFSQIVSGGSGILAADPNSPFVFNNTTTEQVFQGGLTVPGNITLSGNLNLTGAISGNTTGYFNELYITGSAGEWHQVTTGWSGVAGGGGGTTYTAGSGLTLVGTEFNTAGTGVFNQVSGESGVFTDTLTISGNSVLTGSSSSLNKWSDGAGGDIYYNDGDVGIGVANPETSLHIGGDMTIGRDEVIYLNTTSEAMGGGERIRNGHGSTSRSGIAFITADSERMRIVGENDVGEGSSIGNVGIGTTHPTARFHVTGGDGRILAPDGDFSESLTISGNSVVTGAGGKWSDGAGGDIYYNGGDVGIGWSGTAAEPIAAQLHVSGSTIISGSSEITLDYDRLPKADPEIKGRVWINVASGLFMVSAGLVLIIISSHLVRMVSAGEYHSLFLTTAGDVYACGLNDDGQLGDDTTVEKQAPTYITGDVTGISAGARHSMFLSTVGRSYACGQNASGQLGDGTTVDKHVPTYITGGVMGIATQSGHSMFLSTVGHSYACGINTDGQLGDGTTVDKYVPTHITGDVTGISAGERHSVFLSTGGESYACGWNGYGQLGIGTYAMPHVPTSITGDVTGISAGKWHSMFLSTGGHSHACGYGQLGDGSHGVSLVPTFITGDVTGIAAGSDFSMFLSTGSGAYACGYNAQGQLGDDTLVNKAVPTHVTGDVSGISAGRYHSMFFSADKTYYACGYNNHSQLGDGTIVNRSVPTYISGQGA
tara:strand:- start:2952 stop:5198 length:2247 start_codon:yes stop_codon:yes gene_type:complete